MEWMDRSSARRMEEPRRDECVAWTNRETEGLIDADVTGQKEGG